MRDLITYSKDVTLLLAEVATVLPDYLIKDDQHNPVGFAVTKTPTVRKGNETLSVVRCGVAEVKLLKSLKQITVLADVPLGGDLLDVMSTSSRAIYDRIHDQTPVPMLDENGEPVLDANGKAMIITPPELIGAFA